MPKKTKRKRKARKAARVTHASVLRELNKGLKALGYKLVAPIEIEKL
jgi:hypothetical protein